MWIVTTDFEGGADSFLSTQDPTKCLQGGLIRQRDVMQTTRQRMISSRSFVQHLFSYGSDEGSPTGSGFQSIKYTLAMFNHGFNVEVAMKYSTRAAVRRYM
ncbi:hypothetical protein D1006_21500 [Burkholderia stabilis]|uniref:Uncharacterized protein n=1 Tax=Burkholderia stabilis TaxID=95485 RepID=A0A4V1PRJ5_9BURK|nr:hypothetical protein D1006_21500 [Burkholderia stabilis]